MKNFIFLILVIGLSGCGAEQVKVRTNEGLKVQCADPDDKPPCEKPTGRVAIEPE